MSQSSDDLAVELDQALAAYRRQERDEREADLQRQARTDQTLTELLARRPPSPN